ncbi:insect cuticle protein domain-containing protein [Phthorimaea operculella]|nr:insect cuticle protein domain-containing protein [Phthorimaea operculella]
MAATLRLTILSLAAACACAQYAEDRAQYEERAPRYIASSNENKAPPPPPVAILKQINRHNEDGSYTYGYEAADGSFKIETKSPTGEVKGKYGYKDDTGKVRTVEYGANKYGFQPAGEGITVAPPTLVDETKEAEQRAGKSQANRNQYRAQPAQQAPQYRPAPQAAPAPPKPQFFAGAAPAPVEQDQSFFRPAPQPRPQQQRPRPPAVEYSQDFGVGSHQQNFAPAPAQPSFPQQFQQPRGQQPFSMLDQLLKEYALPQGGSAPLHDITFGTF